MLKSVVKACTYEEMFTKIKENIRFASSESKVLSADHVRKEPDSEGLLIEELSGGLAAEEVDLSQDHCDP